MSDQHDAAHRDDATQASTMPAAGTVKHRPIRPVAPAKRRVRRNRARGSLLQRIGIALGVRRTITVDGVRYRERSSDSLRRALSPSGRGFKEYDVTFPAGKPMTIAATRRRIFDDLAPIPRARMYAHATDLITPGDRVLDAACNTGAGANLLAQLVGPSGAVVATDQDNQAIRFARRRYARPNVAYEIGPPTPVAGETDAAFDITVAIDAVTPENAAALLPELARVTRPGGAILLSAPIQSAEAVERAIAPAISPRPHDVRTARVDDRVMCTIRLHAPTGSAAGDTRF